MIEFNDRRANKRALKAANGSSLAPKGYKPDTESRKNVKRFAADDRNNSLKYGKLMGKREAYQRGADKQDFYEKNPTELKAFNRDASDKGTRPIAIDIPKNKRKGK
jgi:hypothetical protein